MPRVCTDLKVKEKGTAVGIEIEGKCNYKEKSAREQKNPSSLRRKTTNLDLSRSYITGASIPDVTDRWNAEQMHRRMNSGPRSR